MNEKKELILVQNYSDKNKIYVQNELILDDYTCECCGQRFEMCICSEEKS